jgi:uncharacterized protein DUF6894
MARYYFDLIGDNGLIVDDDGREMQDLDAVQVEAARSLVDMARDSLLDATSRSVEQLSISVRDDRGSVLSVRLQFQIERND